MQYLGVQRLETTSYGHWCQPRGSSRSKPLRCRTATSTAAGGQAAIIQQLLTRRSYAPPRFVGPIQVSEIPGKRFGLTATQNLPVGALLLVVPPLVAAYGPAGAAPGNAELVSQLQGQQLDPWQLQWLRLLYRQESKATEATEATASSILPESAEGNIADNGDHNHHHVTADRGDVSATSDTAVAELHGQQHTATEQQQQQQDDSNSSCSSSQLAALQQLLVLGRDSDQQQATTATAAGAAAVAVGSVHTTSVTCPFTQDQLEQIIAENAYSEPSEDLGAALLRELDPEAITGLWPEYALLNHSCTPNTVAVVVGQYLLLRATAPVLAGEELTCSYCGRIGFGPVALRRAYVSGVYGFHCQCDRCMTEQSTFPSTYYPADNELLGIIDPNKPSSSSSDTQQQQDTSWISKTLALLGLGSSSSKAQQQDQLRPSKQHRLLVQLHAEAAELQAAVQEAVTADSRRQERQLSLLQQITQKIDTLLGAVDDVAPQLQESRFAQSTQTATKWLVAAAYPLLQLQVELLELLLSSGDLPVDVGQLLYDNNNSTASSGSSRGMAAAGAAAAARLSLTGRSKSNRSGLTGSNGLLSGWGFRPDDEPGPVTKRQLLGLYVQALDRSVQVADAVGRGSEMHVILALKFMDFTRQFYGADSDETRLAEGLCSRAHAARYGVMKGEQQQLLAALISARRRQLLGMSLARKMSVLAWEAATVRD